MKKSEKRNNTSLGVNEKKSDTFKALLIALFAALVLRQFVIASYNVPTGSMKDTILIGDFMFVNKFVYGARSPIWIGVPFTEIGFEIPHFRLPALAEPKRTEILVFDYPKNIKQDYIKRCVAVGGQSVEIKDGILYIDDRPEGEFIPMGQKFDSDPNERLMVTYTHVVPYDGGNPYTIRHFLINSTRKEQMPRLVVPENHYFMMGDNRDNSLDSRSWGFVNRDQIVGKPLMIWLSWDSQVPGYRFYEKIRWDRLGMVLR